MPHASLCGLLASLSFTGTPTGVSRHHGQLLFLTPRTGPFGTGATTIHTTWPGTAFCTESP